MNRSGRTLMNWNRSLTQARSPKPPAARTPWSGPRPLRACRAVRSAQAAAMIPPTTQPAANPITAPVSSRREASVGQISSTANGAETVSRAYCSKLSRANGIAGRIHQASAKGNAAIRQAAIAGLKSLIAESRSSA